MELGLLSTISR